MENVRLVASGLEFPEGPVVLDDGSLLVVEIKNGRLTRIDTDTGSAEVTAELGGGPNGAAIGPDGKVYVCNNGGFEWNRFGDFLVPGHQPADYIGGRVQRVDLGTGEVEDLYLQCDGHALRGPNDLVFDGSGGFWFTDHGKTRQRDRDQGGVYYATADGDSINEVVFPVDAPNGIGLSPGGDRLYYAETHTARVWQRGVTGPGQLAPAMPLDPTTLLTRLPGTALIDSLAVDAEGNVCVATLVTAGITSITPQGESTFYAVPEEYFDPLVTNICFGGRDRRTAYITLSGTGRVVACDWPTAGLALAH